MIRWVQLSFCLGKYGLDEVLAFVRESVVSPLITLDAVAYEAAINNGDAWLIDYFAPVSVTVWWIWKFQSFSGVHLVWDCCLNYGNCIDSSNRWWTSALLIVPFTRPFVNVPMCPGTPNGSFVFSNCFFQLPEYDLSSWWKIASISRLSRYWAYCRVHYRMPSIDYSTVTDIVYSQDARNPSVIELSPEDIKEQVLNRETGHIWLVDFFAPWCGPCQQVFFSYCHMANGNS